MAHCDSDWDDVDDDELVLFSTAGILEAAGHRVLSARSAGEALDLLRVNQVDILITDHAMPLMSGAQLAAVVRETRPQLPVLLVSGYAELPSTTPAWPRSRTRPAPCGSSTRFSTDPLTSVLT